MRRLKYLRCTAPHNQLWLSLFRPFFFVSAIAICVRPKREKRRSKMATTSNNVSMINEYVICNMQTHNLHTLIHAEYIVIKLVMHFIKFIHSFYSARKKSTSEWRANEIMSFVVYCDQPSGEDYKGTCVCVQFTPIYYEHSLRFFALAFTASLPQPQRSHQMHKFNCNKLCTVHRALANIQHAYISLQSTRRGG